MAQTRYQAFCVTRCVLPLALLILAACSPKQKQVVIAPYVAPGDSECAAFATQLNQAVAAGKIEQLLDMVDWDRLCAISMRSLGTPKFRQGFRKGLKAALNKPNSMFTEIIRQVKEGGSYVCLRTRDVGRKKQVLFRIRNADDSLNYHGFNVCKSADGSVRAEDVWIGISGENLSTTFRRLFLPVLAKQRSLTGRLRGVDKDWMAGMTKLKDMRLAIGNNQPQKALDLFATLPDSLRGEKVALLARIQAAMALEDEAQYLQGLTDFRKEHPDAACIDLVSIDWHLLRKQPEKSLAAIDRLSKSLGGDPYLLAMKAGIATEQGDFADAKTWAAAAIKAEPGLMSARWLQIRAVMALQEHDETLRLLIDLKDNHGVQLDELKRIKNYASFAESPQHKKWLSHIQAESK